jgi:hypothetical protein
MEEWVLLVSAKDARFFEIHRGRSGSELPDDATMPTDDGVNGDA